MRVLIALTVAGKLAAQSAIAFTNVTVVDVEKGVLRPNQTIVIEGNRICAVDDAPRVHAPRTARVISGKGKYLIPGLWGMHLHEMPSPRGPELFVANGMTGIGTVPEGRPRKEFENPTCWTHAGLRDHR